MLSRDLGFVRTAMSVPRLKVADVAFNVNELVSHLRNAQDQDVQVLAFPEMAIVGYTIADLVHQDALLRRAAAGLEVLCEATRDSGMLVLVGAPLEVNQKVYNCAVALSAGKILGVVPKAFLPAYKEFYEERWFASGRDVRGQDFELFGQIVPFGTDLLFPLSAHPAATIAVEICEDLWVPVSPHAHQALAGATILVNISASNEIIAKSDWRRTMVLSESGRCLAAYCYTSSGLGESSNDVVFSGHAMVAENGTLLAESTRLVAEPQLVVGDIDVERLGHDRRVTNTFYDTEPPYPFRRIRAEVADHPPDALRRDIDPHPFVPGDPARRRERCEEIFSMQVAGLAQKIAGAHQEHIVLGVSGGLDSTLSLLVAAKTVDFLGLPRSNVHAFTLPGFGTTRRTRSNAQRLCRALGVEFETAPIARSATAHLKDLGHEGEEDVVFENAQARYRTEFLFNKANQLHAIVLGTGDLTEIALGWCTFSGDHISHYHVNGSVPKTLVQYLIGWVADEDAADGSSSRVLRDILATPISPELRRPVEGRIAQMSEDVIGPVELADFYLYPFVRHGMPPGKILYLADEARRCGAFDGQYELDDLYKWLKSFVRRFFTNQFKRTCFPETPKIGSVSLSPRGDWRMSSESSPGLWLEDLDAMYERLRHKNR